jgi:DNA invertase Pin-like site-specific DNA recombinase
VCSPLRSGISLRGSIHGFQRFLCCALAGVSHSHLEVHLGRLHALQVLIHIPMPLEPFEPFERSRHGIEQRVRLLPITAGLRDTLSGLLPAHASGCPASSGPDQVRSRRASTASPTSRSTACAGVEKRSAPWSTCRPDRVAQYQIYKSLLRKYGISVISMNEQVDESPAGMLLEGMIEVIDEFYSTNLAQDTLRGMKENAGRGYHNGGVVPIGYQAKTCRDGANEKTRLEPDESFTPIIQRIFQMCADGMGAKEIVKTLNGEGLRTNTSKLWNKNTIYYILKNEIYTGTLVWNRQTKSQGRAKPKDPKEIIRIEHNHPAIASREMFEKVRALLRERSPEITHPRTLNSEYLLSGLLYCGKCGAGMLGCAAKSSRFFYYAYHNYCKRGKDVCNPELIKQERIEGFVIHRIKAHLLTEDNL